MKIEKLKPGMVVHLHGTTRSFTKEKCSWPVHIMEVDLTNRRVLASWNYNTSKWYSEYNASKWRAISYSETRNKKALKEDAKHKLPEVLIPILEKWCIKKIIMPTHLRTRFDSWCFELVNVVLPDRQSALIEELNAALGTNAAYRYQGYMIIPYDYLTKDQKCT